MSHILMLYTSKLARRRYFYVKQKKSVSAKMPFLHNKLRDSYFKNQVFTVLVCDLVLCVAPNVLWRYFWLVCDLRWYDVYKNYF